jgi:hypothetical protein
MQLLQVSTKISKIKDKFGKQMERLRVKRSAVSTEREECMAEGSAIAKVRSGCCTDRVGGRDFTVGDVAAV